MVGMKYWVYVHVKLYDSCDTMSIIIVLRFKGHVIH